MNGLWHVPTTAIKPGISVFVVDFFGLLIIALFTLFAITQRPKGWSEAIILHVGLVFLTIYSFFHWTDITHRQFAKGTTYGSLFANTFYQIFRVFSEVLILWGCSRLMVRYQHLRNDQGVLSTHEDSPYWIGITLLWILGIYQLCLQFALSSAWLYFADLGVINELAQTQSAFNIAYSAAQFFYSIYLTVGFDRLPHNQAYSPGDGQDPLKPENLYVNEKNVAGIAAFTLLARSLSELVLLSLLNRWARHLSKIYFVRDILYTVLSALMVFWLVGAVPPDENFVDPLTKEKTDNYQAEQTAKQAARQRVRDWINPKIEEMTASGTKTAPTMNVLLTLLESEIGAWVPINDPYNLLEEMRFEIAGLRELHGDWEPIFKVDRVEALEK